MFPKDLRRGAFLNGKRITGLAPARRNGCSGVVVTLNNQVAGVFYPDGVRVPGTTARTDMPAGPVSSGGGTHYTRPGRRDGESSRDRHSRLIDSITYA